MRSAFSALVLLLALCAVGCSAPAPGHAVYVAKDVGATLAADVVRAEDPDLAVEVATMLVDVKPAVIAALPGTRDRRLEIWVQDELSLFRGETAGHDVDGFYVVGTGRIHLRRESSDRMRSTLAHELVHALADDTWRTLPPVVEEGLADWIAAQVCDESTSRIRAGRLGDAGGSLGGLSMRLRLSSPSRRSRTSWPSRITLASEASLELSDVFAPEVEGLDALRASTDVRPGLYGCGFLLVDRIVERRGLRHLRGLCLMARREGYGHVRQDALLDAAELAMSPRAWNVAAARALGDDDVAEMGRRHASSLAAALDVLLGAGSSDDLLRRYDAEWGPLWGEARVSLAEIDEVREALAARADADDV